MVNAKGTKQDEQDGMDLSLHLSRARAKDSGVGLTAEVVEAVSR
jgi:hypothetical protein